MMNAIDFYLAIKKGRYAVFIATTRGGQGVGGNRSTALAIGNPEKGEGGNWGRQQKRVNKMI